MSASGQFPGVRKILGQTSSKLKKHSDQMSVLAVYQEISLSVLRHTFHHTSHDYLARWALRLGNYFQSQLRFWTPMIVKIRYLRRNDYRTTMPRCVGKCCACVLSGCTARLLRAPLSISTHRLRLQLCQADGVGRYITQFSLFNKSHKPKKSLFFTFRRVEEGLRFFVFLPWGSTIFLIKCSNIHLFVNLYFMLSYLEQTKNHFFSWYYKFKFNVIQFSTNACLYISE